MKKLQKGKKKILKQKNYEKYWKTIQRMPQNYLRSYIQKANITQTKKQQLIKNLLLLLKR